MIEDEQRAMQRDLRERCVQYAAQSGTQPHQLVPHAEKLYDFIVGIDSLEATETPKENEGKWEWSQGKKIYRVPKCEELKSLREELAMTAPKIESVEIPTFDTDLPNMIKTKHFLILFFKAQKLLSNLNRVLAGCDQRDRT